VALDWIGRRLGRAARVPAPAELTVVEPLAEAA
jgi:hypothetical protein